MKATSAILSAICVLSVPTCSTSQQQQQPSNTPPMFRRNTPGEEQLSANWPFPVVAAVGGFDLPQDLVSQLRTQFLTPLAKSQFTHRIAKVEVFALSPEYEQWACVIHLTDGLQPIRLEHFASFYDGRASNHYAAATRYVLDALRRIEQYVKPNQGN